MRKDFLEKYSNAIPQNIRLLQDFVALKNRYANLLDYSCFSEYAMYNSLVEKPSSLKAFLKSFTQSMQPTLVQFVQDIDKFQKTLSYGVKELQWWDLNTYMNIYANQGYKLQAEEVLNAVTVEGIIEGGMKPLLQSLFHVYLEEQKTEEDELWHHSAPITKYQVIHESRGFLGDLYLDLYNYPGRNIANSFITIKGRCKFDDNSIQHPIAVISMCYPRVSNNKDSFVYMGQANSFFHELGHAMQLFLTDTNYQTISGTRVSSDAVEIPSTLFEYFFSDKDFLSSINEASIRANPSAVRLSSTAIEYESSLFEKPSVLQIFHLAATSLIDQALAGENHEKNPVSTVYADIWNQYFPLKLPGTISTLFQDESFVNNFGTGYVYLLSKIIASDIFYSAKQKYNHILCPEFGDSISKELLSKGSKIPQSTILHNLLGRDYSFDALISHLQY